MVKRNKRWISNSYLIRKKTFKGTNVNCALSSLHEGSLEIKLTFPLTVIFKV